jgi:hypothetical protein
MSAMKKLDSMIQDISMSPNEYEANKAIIIKCLNGDLNQEELPENIKDVMFQWEASEMELVDLQPAG